MGWLRDHSFIISLGVFLVSGIVSALVIGYIGVVVWFAFASGQMTMDFLLDFTWYLPVIAVLLVLTTVSGLSLGWTALRRFSLPRSDRLSSVFEQIERKNSTLDTLGLSTAVEPPEQSDEEKLEAAKQRYVEGEIDEDEFEREIERLTITDSDDEYADRVRESRNIERER